MNTFKTILLLACVVACAVAEPPRRRSNFKSFKFARQEVEESGSTPDEQPQVDDKPGYSYTPPAESQRLRLPGKVRVSVFARQEEAPPSNGYNYPKPDSTYGPPTETTEEPEPEVTTPNPEYGVPAEEPTTTAQPEESTDQPEEATTTNPQAEQLKNVRAAQLRRQKVKSQKFVIATQQQQLQRVQQQAQPIFYFQYPVPTDFDQQYVYIFK
ncbi:hypothetical protein ACKWTF_005896 [Chironomus riparius]